jgi:hypothetical protein
VKSELSSVANYIRSLSVFQVLSLIPSLIQFTSLSTVAETDLHLGGEIDLEFK